MLGAAPATFADPMPPTVPSDIAPQVPPALARLERLLDGGQPTDKVPPPDLAQALHQIAQQWNEPEDWSGDERNIVLALARIWYSLSTGAIAPKHVAAQWALERLPVPYREVLRRARDAYVGQRADGLAQRPQALAAYVHFVKGMIAGLHGAAIGIDAGVDVDVDIDVDDDASPGDRQGVGKAAAASPLDLSRLGPSLYAQGTEEAILDRLLACIPPQHRYCVDIGASDGLRNSNTALLLRERGWQGLLVEASAYRYAQLCKHYGATRQVSLRHECVQPATVQAMLDEAGVPPDFDLLSIDIDGNDFWIWQAIERHRPRIVVIEYNPYYTPPERWVMRHDPDHQWDGSSYYGASLESLCALGQSKGYELVCCDDMGNNAFFVRAEFFAALGIGDNSPSVLFRPALYKLRYVGHNTFLSGHPYRYGPAEQI